MQLLLLLLFVAVSDRVVVVAVDDVVLSNTLVIQSSIRSNLDRPTLHQMPIFIFFHFQHICLFQNDRSGSQNSDTRSLLTDQRLSNANR